MIHLLDGKPVIITLDLVIGVGDEAITHPADNLKDPEYRAALGIVDVEEESRPNDKFYLVGEVRPDGTYPKEPKDLDELKKLLVSEVKATANAILAQTGWMIERAADPSSGVPIPPEVVTYRGAVRDACNDNEAAILAADAVEALEMFKPVWPEVQQ